MILWHLGATAAIVYVSLGRRRIDYRCILLGAIVPDAIDAVLSAVTDLPQRSVAHSLLAPVAVSIAIILGLRGERRLAWFGVGVGWLLHLALDGMWGEPRIFFWPAFGSAWPPGALGPFSLDVLTHPLDHLGLWGLEIAGALLLLWFWVAFEFGDEDRRRAWLKDGHLRA
ncbi:MAG TPA: metal-dependent hydrolase [Actinomycetota bacterium]|nr:metal-dependent hydrolase [Actinomycetota bacterium]